MDIEKLKAEFEQSECFKRLEHVAQYTFFEFGAYIKRTDVPADIEKKCGKLITALLFSWSAWKEAKAQAVPDLSELQERIAGHQYYHDEHSHMIVDMDDVVKEISGFDSWKAQAVPEWFDYTKQSPQMDGNYQIFIKGEQITAKWVSRFGFADPIEGDALRQELITHWAMQPQSPKAQEPANE